MKTYKFASNFGPYLGYAAHLEVEVERLNPGKFPHRYRFVDGPTWLEMETTTHLTGDPEEGAKMPEAPIPPRKDNYY